MQIIEFNKENVESGDDFIDKFKKTRDNTNINVCRFVIQYSKYNMKYFSETLETTTKTKNEFFTNKVKYYIQESVNERNKILRWINGYDFNDIDESGNINEYNIYINRENIGSITHMINYHVLAIEAAKEYAKNIMMHYKNNNYYTWRNFWAVIFGCNYNLKDSCDKIKHVHDSLLETSLMVEPDSILYKHKQIHKKLECIKIEYNKYKKQQNILEENIKKYIKKEIMKLKEII